MSKGKESGYKDCVSHVFAQSACKPKPHSKQSGDKRRLSILHALARSRQPLTAGEIQKKTGLPRRTVHYYLAKLVDEGYVVRVGKAPLSYYELTNKGKRAVARSLLNVQTDPLGRAGVVRERVVAGGGGRVTVYVSRVDNELRVRAKWAPFRRVIRRVLGRDIKGVAFRHMYTRNGTVHYDSRHAFTVEDLWGDLLGMLGNFFFVGSVLKEMVGVDVLVRLLLAAPRVEVVVVEQAEILRWG